MRREYNFTLVELLVTVGIIAILAGLVLPAVRMVQQRGRVTAAKSDMTAILMALKGVETTYGKMVKSSYSFDETSLTPSSNVITFSDDAYNAFIAELSVPAKVSTLNVNKRKMKFLDPKPDFDMEKAYNHADNLPKLWRDPWGNPYKLLINVNGENSIPHPSTDVSKTLAAKAVVYSFGPNGTDDKGLNIEQDTEATKLMDDIASWHK